MDQFPFTALKDFVDVAEGLNMAELADEQETKRHPIAKPIDVASELILANTGVQISRRPVGSELIAKDLWR